MNIMIDINCNFATYLISRYNNSFISKFILTIYSYFILYFIVRFVTKSKQYIFTEPVIDTIRIHDELQHKWSELKYLYGNAISSRCNTIILNNLHKAIEDIRKILTVAKINLDDEINDLEQELTTYDGSGFKYVKPESKQKTIHRTYKSKSNKTQGST